MLDVHRPIETAELRLTAARTRVLTLLAHGMSQAQAAHHLGISVSGVRAHVRAIWSLAERLTGRTFTNTLGAAFALQMAGIYTHRPLEDLADDDARAIRACTQPD